MAIAKRRSSEHYSRPTYAALKDIVTTNPGIDMSQVEELLIRQGHSLDKVMGAIDHGLSNDNLRKKRRGASEMVFQVDRSGPNRTRVGRRLFLRNDAPGEEIVVTASAYQAEGADNLVEQTLRAYQADRKIDLRGSKSLQEAIQSLLKLR